MPFRHLLNFWAEFHDLGYISLLSLPSHQHKRANYAAIGTIVELFFKVFKVPKREGENESLGLAQRIHSLFQTAVLSSNPEKSACCEQHESYRSGCINN